MYRYEASKSWVGETRHEVQLSNPSAYLPEYIIEIADSGTLETYEIVSNFEITSSGNTVTDFEHGMLLSSDELEPELLNFVQEIEIEKYHPKEIKVFGIVQGYISGTPINISVVNNQGNIHEFSVFAVL